MSFKNYFRIFLNFFQNFIKFLWNFFTVSLRVFHFFFFSFFFIINSNLSLIFAKFLRKVWNFRKMSEEFSQFFGNTPKNARFFKVPSQLVHCSHFWTHFHCLKRFSEVFHIFSIFNLIYTQFFPTCCSSNVISYFLTVFL